MCKLQSHRSPCEAMWLEQRFLARLLKVSQNMTETRNFAAPRAEIAVPELVGWLQGNPTNPPEVAVGLGHERLEIVERSMNVAPRSAYPPSEQGIYIWSQRFARARGRWGHYEKGNPLGAPCRPK